MWHPAIGAYLWPFTGVLSRIWGEVTRKMQKQPRITRM